MTTICLSHGVQEAELLAHAVFLVFGAWLGWAEDSLARRSGTICPLQDFPACFFVELPKQGITLPRLVFSKPP